jgi:hypothetical protein
MPRIDLEPQKNGTLGPKDGREAVGGYPHLPPSDRTKFEPTEPREKVPEQNLFDPHTSYELSYATRDIG